MRYLAGREHSRSELARKLARHAATEAELEAVLAQLQAQKLLSDERFADMLARTRGARFGTARVKHELAGHRLDPALVKRTVSQLQASELARARELWERRFGTPAADYAERGRQMRFLAARGFAPAVIRQVVRGIREDELPDAD